MTTYVYETIPTKPGETPRRFEIRQSMNDAPLTRVPETGEPVRRVIAAWLARSGHTVLTAGRGLDLVKSLRRGHPEVFLAGVGGLTGRGLDMAEAVRRISDIPIVLMSGAWSPDLQIRAAAIRAVMLPKPFAMAELVAAVVRRPDGAAHAPAGRTPERICG